MTTTISPNDIKTDAITDASGTGAPSFPNGIKSGNGPLTLPNGSVAGTLSVATSVNVTNLSTTSPQNILFTGPLVCLKTREAATSKLSAGLGVPGGTVFLISSQLGFLSAVVIYPVAFTKAANCAFVTSVMSI